jgi:hypothetical protein
MKSSLTWLSFVIILPLTKTFTVPTSKTIVNTRYDAYDNRSNSCERKYVGTPNIHHHKNCNNLHSSSSSSSSSSSLLRLSPIEIWDEYNMALNTDPLLVKSITAGVLLGAADLTGQLFENSTNEKSNKEIDIIRTIRFAIFGLVLQAPWNHYYYLVLDGQIPPTPDEPFSMTNIIKVCIDQFIQAPIFTVLIFVFLGLCEGKALSSIKQQLDTDYKETIIANCKYQCLFFLIILNQNFSNNS